MKAFTDIAVTFRDELSEGLMREMDGSVYNLKYISPDSESIISAVSDRTNAALMIKSSRLDPTAARAITEMNRDMQVFVFIDEDLPLPDYEPNSRLIPCHLPLNPKNVLLMLNGFREVSLSGYDRASRLRGRVTELLLEGMITPDLVGFHYLRDAIVYYILTGCEVSCLKKDLYRRICEKRGATESSVEHGIRCCVDQCWSRSGDDFRRRYFGTLGITRSKKPTPKQFITTISERLIRDMRAEERNVPQI